eukprot:CAMPEP_0176317788 /NCGR_PEP_ID=MMETSP0121_2-20121125/69437_1 /TAXON_ID=160619 /ORGANISM="Kryptoperidinium foliaceum, Strain CCMP 1326" /LENGTH=169 /DNA_ID=CAMNT_0017660057 /DNA_START=43 /DNA_END=548 /DNA_ORIENTATION=-
MPFVLKLRCQGEVRRAQLVDEELSYDAVRGMIRTVWPELGDFAATYTDEDGDRCSLCAATFPDFRTHGEEKGGQTLFRLELSASRAEPSVDAPSCGEPPAAAKAAETAAAEAQPRASDVGARGEPSVHAPGSGEQPAAMEVEAKAAETEEGGEPRASDVAWKGKGKGKG